MFDPITSTDSSRESECGPWCSCLCCSLSVYVHCTSVVSVVADQYSTVCVCVCVCVCVYMCCVLRNLCMYCIACAQPQYSEYSLRISVSSNLCDSPTGQQKSDPFAGVSSTASVQGGIPPTTSTQPTSVATEPKALYSSSGPQQAGTVHPQQQQQQQQQQQPSGSSTSHLFPRGTADSFPLQRDQSPYGSQSSSSSLTSVQQPTGGYYSGTTPPTVSHSQPTAPPTAPPSSVFSTSTQSGFSTSTQQGYPSGSQSGYTTSSYPPTAQSTYPTQQQYYGPPQSQNQIYSSQGPGAQYGGVTGQQRPNQAPYNQQYTRYQQGYQ